MKYKVNLEGDIELKINEWKNASISFIKNFVYLLEHLINKYSIFCWIMWLKYYFVFFYIFD